LLMQSNRPRIVCGEEVSRTATARSCFGHIKHAKPSQLAPGSRRLGHPKGHGTIQRFSARP
jgi:hypothetical protein